MGIIIAIVSFALSGGTVIALFRRLRRQQVKTARWVAFYVLLLFGTLLGIWFSFLLIYPFGARYRIGSFPIPIVIFHLENGTWALHSRPSSIHIWSQAIANVVIVTALATFPMWFSFRHRSQKSAAKGFRKRVARIWVPFSIIGFSFLLSWYLCASFLTMEWSFDKVFDTTAQDPPTGTMTIQINGAHGGVLNLGETPPTLTTNSLTGKVDGFNWNTTPSEKSTLTPKKLNEIKVALGTLDPQKWAVLTKLPSPIFRYNLALLSDRTANWESYQVTVGNDYPIKDVKPGDEIVLGDRLQVEDISQTLASTKISLIYTMGTGTVMSTYDSNGKFVSHTTGMIVIHPTFMTEVFVFAGTWTILLGFLKLMKETMLFPKDLDEVKQYYK